MKEAASWILYGDDSATSVPCHVCSGLACMDLTVTASLVELVNNATIL